MDCRKSFITIVLLLLPSFVCAQMAYGPTKINDHLWQIAKQNRPSNAVSIKQTVAAIFKLNPSAFIDGNMNHLKKGVMLSLPTLEQVEQASLQKARKTIAVHHQPQDKKILTSGKAVHVNKLTSQSTVDESLQSKIKKTAKPAPHQSNDLKKIDYLEKQIAQALQQQVAFKEQMSMQVAHLVANSQTYEKQIDTTKNEIMQLKHAVFSVQSSFKKLSQHHEANNKKRISPMNLIIASGLLLALVIFFFLPASKPVIVEYDTDDEDEGYSDDPFESEEDEEYDFMGSEEGLSAKLDLARAYLDMGDINAAKETLQEVITKGNDKQREQAMKMLNHIES